MDIAFAMVRHLTSVSAAQFLDELEHELVKYKTAEVANADGKHQHEHSSEHDDDKQHDGYGKQSVVSGAVGGSAPSKPPSADGPDQREDVDESATRSEAALDTALIEKNESDMETTCTSTSPTGGLVSAPETMDAQQPITQQSDESPPTTEPLAVVGNAERQTARRQQEVEALLSQFRQSLESVEMLEARVESFKAKLPRSQWTELRSIEDEIVKIWGDVMTQQKALQAEFPAGLEEEPTGPTSPAALEFNSLATRVGLHQRQSAARPSVKKERPHARTAKKPRRSS